MSVLGEHWEVSFCCPGNADEMGCRVWKAWKDGGPGGTRTPNQAVM